MAKLRAELPADMLVGVPSPRLTHTMLVARCRAVGADVDELAAHFGVRGDAIRTRLDVMTQHTHRRSRHGQAAEQT